MTATQTAPVEALLREQVANGHVPSLENDVMENDVRLQLSDKSCSAFLLA